MPNDVRPYLVPRPGTVTWEPWELLDGEWGPMPAEFEGWDAGSDLVIRRTLRVNTERLRAETGLDHQNVVVGVSWTSSTTGMKDAIAPERVAASGLSLVHAVLPGERIAGTVDIRATLCLAAPAYPAQPGVARLPGSILDEHKQSIVVERHSSMFPVNEIDFAATRLSPDASWHLETTTELTAPFYGTFRVLLNKRDVELCRAVARGTRDRRQQALVDELEAGVAALLLELAVLLNDELVERPEWPTDSVGDVLVRILVRSQLPGHTVPTATDLAVFRTGLAGAVRARGQGRHFS